VSHTFDMEAFGEIVKGYGYVLGLTQPTWIVAECRCLDLLMERLIDDANTKQFLDGVQREDGLQIRINCERASDNWSVSVEANRLDPFNQDTDNKDGGIVLLESNIHDDWHRIVERHLPDGRLP